MRPKILFILHLPPPVHGAALMGDYIKRNKRINETFENSFLNLSASKSIDSIGKASSKKALFFVQLVYSTIKSLFRNKYSVCYVTLTSKGTAFYKDFLIVTILKIFGKKILLHFHNKGVAEGSKANKINRFFYRFVLGGKKTKIILLSPFLYSDISQYAEPARIFYCANGIPETTNTPPIKIKHSRTRLLFLSNMMMAKGVFTLLETCLQLKKKNIDFECHFVGDWLDITEDVFNEKVKQLGLGDVVTAHGKKYGIEKNKFYQDADIFVMPSFDEAFSLVLLEAMQFGLPVVASNVGGIPDIVADNVTGYLVPRQDACALSEKLVALINNFELRTSMGIAARKRYEENFTMDKFESRFLNILNQVANAA